MDKATLLGGKHHVVWPLSGAPVIERRNSFTHTHPCALLLPNFLLLCVVGGVVVGVVGGCRWWQVVGRGGKSVVVSLIMLIGRLLLRFDLTFRERPVSRSNANPAFRERQKAQFSAKPLPQQAPRAPGSEVGTPCPAWPQSLRRGLGCRAKAPPAPRAPSKGSRRGSRQFAWPVSGSNQPHKSAGIGQRRAHARQRAPMIW